VKGPLDCFKHDLVRGTFGDKGGGPASHHIIDKASFRLPRHHDHWGGNPFGQIVIQRFLSAAFEQGKQAQSMLSTHVIAIAGGRYAQVQKDHVEDFCPNMIKCFLLARGFKHGGTWMHPLNETAHTRSQNAMVINQ